MNSTRKMIKITSRGPINAKHGIYGPILSPYMEETKTIFRMISEGHKVVEIMDDKSELELHPSNFNTDNTIVKTEVAVVVEEAPPAPPVIVKEEREPQQKKQQPPFNNKYDKRNKYNKYEEKKETVSKLTPIVQETEISTPAQQECDVVEPK